MAEQLADTDHGLPRVIVARRVIDKMVRGALLYPEPETGEALIGLVAPQPGRAEPDIYVLDTISPGERTVREWGMFEQGDDWQGDVFHWLYVNWDAFRELRRPSYGSGLAAKWDMPLRHVGDWHKQPGDMTEPSPGDAQTARRMIADSETPVEQVIAPIVTLYALNDAMGRAVDEGMTPGPDAERPSHTLWRTADEDGWRVRIDFWYMSRRARDFVAIAPVVWPNERLPELPPVAWHLAHPRRFDQEYKLLIDAGYTVDVVRWDADGRPPYEVCFSVHQPGSTRALLLVTSVDYPARMPAVRVAPLVSVQAGEDLFERLYEASQPALMTQMPDWEWDSKRTLIELVWHFEKVFKENPTP